MTLRLDEALTDRLRAVAAARGQSVNRFAEAVLRAAVDPDLADTESARLRERLERAGLLAHLAPSRALPPSEPEVARARAAAGRGRPLSDLVSEGRD